MGIISILYTISVFMISTLLGFDFVWKHKKDKKGVLFFSIILSIVISLFLFFISHKILEKGYKDIQEQSKIGKFYPGYQ